MIEGAIGVQDGLRGSLRLRETGGSENYDGKNADSHGRASYTNAEPSLLECAGMEARGHELTSFACYRSMPSFAIGQYTNTALP